MGPPAVHIGPRSSDVSASESSANIDTEEEDHFQSTIPNLERFYEQMAAKARLPTHPPGNAVNANWVLSLARSYRRLSKEKRSRGRLRALLQRPGAEGDFDLSETSSLEGLPPGALRPKTVTEGPGWSSNTDDSGYEAGYETEADESEWSEWEGGQRQTRRHGHKRKLDALVHLTMRLNVVGRDQEKVDEEAAQLAESAAGLPPIKAPRAFGTQPVGLRFSLPHTPPAADQAMPFAARRPPMQLVAPQPFSSGSFGAASSLLRSSSSSAAAAGSIHAGLEANRAASAASQVAAYGTACADAHFEAYTSSNAAPQAAMVSMGPQVSSASSTGHLLADGISTSMEVC